MKYLTNLIIITGLTSFLIGCGGSSSDNKPPATEYTGSLSKATLTSSNSKPLSISSTEASKTSSAAETFSSFKTGSTGSSSDDIDSMVMKTAEAAVRNASETVDGVCSSGSLVVDGIDPNADPFGYLNLTIKYSDCTFIGTVPALTVDGTAKFEGYLFDNNFTITYTDFTITHDGQTDTINLIITCTPASCTINTDFKGDDGRIYRVENFTVSGDNFSGYYVSGRVYDPDHGYIDITTISPIFFSECAKGNPSSGEIEFTDGTNTVTVTYNSCTSYTVTFDDGLTITPETYTW